MFMSYGSHSNLLSGVVQCTVHMTKQVEPSEILQFFKCFGAGCAGCVHASNGWAGGNLAHPEI